MTVPRSMQGKLEAGHGAPGLAAEWRDMDARLTPSQSRELTRMSLRFNVCPKCDSSQSALARLRRMHMEYRRRRT